MHAGSVTLDESDSTHLTVILPEPFPEGVTRYNGWNGILGTVYRQDSSGNNAALPFALDDSVGPLIADAALIERLTAGDDTLVIEFSEYVDYTTLKGQSLTLLKTDGQGTVTKIPLQVSTAYPDDSQFFFAIVPFTDEASAPKPGDSLRITADGPVIDGFSNRAHQLNRPIMLTSKKISPDIIGAVYEDRNADGMIDTVRIVFNKTVTLDALETDIDWNGKSYNVTLPQFRRVESGQNGDTVDVAIGSPQFSPDDLEDRTSEPMRITARFNDYEEDNRKAAVVRDGAAPVLAAARFHYGEWSAADTIYVRFTEEIQSMQWTDQPLLFQKSGGERYSVSVGAPSTVYLEIEGKTGMEKYYREGTLGSGLSS